MTSYISKDILDTVSQYMGYVPVGVSREWDKSIDIDITLNTLVSRYRDIETIVYDGDEDQIRFAIKCITMGAPIPHDVDEVLFAAVRKNYVWVARWAMENGAVCISTAVECAASKGNIDMVKYLLTLFSDNNVWAAMAAATSGHIDVVKLFTIIDSDSVSMIATSAAEYGYFDIVTYLNDTYGITIWDHVLQWIAYYGRIDMIKDITTRCNVDWAYIEYGAAQGGNLDIVMMALEHTDNPQYAACTAASRDHLHIVQAILDKYMDSIDIIEISDAAHNSNALSVIEWLDVSDVRHVPHQ